MIRPGITTKLFLTLIATIFVVIGVLLWWINWSFDRGFVRYVNSEDERRVEVVASFLEDQYRLNGSWMFIEGQDRALRQIARELTSPRPAGPMGRGQGMRPSPMARGDLGRTGGPPPAELSATDPLAQVEEGDGIIGGPRRPMGSSMAAQDSSQRPPPREDGGLPLPERLSLYDADGEILVRSGAGERGSYERRLNVDGNFVGSLWLVHQERPTDAFDVAFSDQQTQTNILIAMALFGFSIVVSLLLSRNLVGTVKEVASGARELAAGNWSSRIDIVSNDEVGQLARDFNDLARVLEANEHSRRQWIADISHELRTPITILIGEIEAIMDGARSATPDALRSLHDEANRMKNLVGDLYHLALSDVGALDYRKEWVSLHDIIEDVTNHFRDRFSDAGIDLQFETNPGPHASLYGDPDRLYQLFSNLLQNSARYTDSGGVCRITMDERSEGIHVYIDDSAPGVDEESLPRLFDRLYRVETSRNRATGGAGLGLAICANIVSGHDGTISAHPSSLGGLRLSLFFPYRTPIN